MPRSIWSGHHNDAHCVEVGGVLIDVESIQGTMCWLCNGARSALLSSFSWPPNIHQPCQRLHLCYTWVYCVICNLYVSFHKKHPSKRKNSFILLIIGSSWLASVSWANPAAQTANQGGNRILCGPVMNLIRSYKICICQSGGASGRLLVVEAF